MVMPAKSAHGTEHNYEDPKHLSMAPTLIESASGFEADAYAWDWMCFIARGTSYVEP